MFPQFARLYMCPFTDEEIYTDRTAFWSNVYGLNFSSLMFVPLSAFPSHCAYALTLTDHLRRSVRSMNQ
jgi:hypothetical protein